MSQSWGPGTSLILLEAEADKALPPEDRLEPVAPPEVRDLASQWA